MKFFTAAVVLICVALSTVDGFSRTTLSDAELGSILGGDGLCETAIPSALHCSECHDIPDSGGLAKGVCHWDEFGQDCDDSTDSTWHYREECNSWGYPCPGMMSVYYLQCIPDNYVNDDLCDNHIPQAASVTSDSFGPCPVP